MNFPNVAAATKFLNHNANSISLTLVSVLEQHAVATEPVVIESVFGEIADMKFTSTHAVEEEIEVGDETIIIHEAYGLVVCTIKTNPKPDQETTMNTNNQTNASTTPPVYSQEERDALLAKMAAMQAAMDAMQAAQPKAAAAEKPKAAAKPAAPVDEDNSLAMAIGKGILYTAGAVAAGAAGVWAWKKWGPSSSTQA